MKTYQKQYKIKTHLKTSGSESVILPEAKVFIFRIILEALANVQKHAEASEVTVKVITKKSVLTAAIIDNGAGFKPKKNQKNKQTSFGLEAISERARLLGGEATIKSHLGLGTTVSIEIPLPEVAV